VSKTSVFWIPVVGWAMWTIGYVGLKRKEQRSIREMTRRCARSIGEGVPLVIFPEGTRSPTGELQAFKNGAFLIAKLAKCPVLPMALRGTFDALPRGKWLIRAGVKIRVTVLPLVPADTVEAGSPADVAARCRGLIAAELAQVD
jgi:1-acyl-sn-glycerol-3-phosphate acyltransferase